MLTSNVFNALCAEYDIFGEEALADIKPPLEEDYLGLVRLLLREIRDMRLWANEEQEYYDFIIPWCESEYEVAYKEMEVNNRAMERAKTQYLGYYSAQVKVPVTETDNGDGTVTRLQSR